MQKIFTIPLDDVDQWLEKAAHHKYLRRIPTGKKNPKYTYIYTLGGNAKNHSTKPAEGEKMKAKHDGVEGHYEVINAGNGKVTIKHDVTGKKRTITLEQFRTLFYEEHQADIEAKRAKYAKDFEQAKKTGTQKQQDLRHEEVLAFEAMFPTSIEKYSPEEQIERLVDLGNSMHHEDDFGPVEENFSGFNRYDWRAWPSVSGDLFRMHGLLKKYKGQIASRYGEREYAKLGLDLEMEDPTLDENGMLSVDATLHPRWGSVLFEVIGRVPSAIFHLYKDTCKDYGMRFDWDTKSWYLPKDKIEDHDHAALQKDMKDMGLKFPDMPKPPKAKNPSDASNKTAPPPKEDASAEDIRDGIQARQVADKISVTPYTLNKVEGWIFHAPFSREFNAVFSNKSGSAGHVTEYVPQAHHGRFTNSLEVAESAIEVLKVKIPEFEVVVSDKLGTAQQIRDTRHAELREPIPEVSAKLSPQIKLFPYQNEGVRFIQEKDGNVILGDEMGLGKTLQSLAYVAAEHKRAIVVVPKVVRKTWIDEADKFFPGHFDSRELKPKDLKKDAKGEVIFPDLSGHNLVTVNYESLEKWRPALEAAGFDTLIVDESHRVKSPKAKITKTVTAIAKNMKHRILMSGTAAKNKRVEFYTQTEIVKPGLFESAGAIKGSTIGGMWHKLQGIYMARQKANVLTDLPTKSTQLMTHAIKNPPKLPKDIGGYSQMRGTMAVAKVDSTLDMVSETMKVSESAIIVFTESVEAAKQMAEKLGPDAILHHGTLSDEKKEQAKADFQKKDGPRVFVTTRQSMAVGATLTRADKVIFNDLPWSPADIRQAEDRAHRIGQQNNVNVYWNVAENSPFDVLVANILRRKYDLVAKVNEGKVLTEEEREWMTATLSNKEVMDEIAGVETKPQRVARRAKAAKKEKVDKLSDAKKAVARLKARAEARGEYTAYEGTEDEEAQAYIDSLEERDAAWQEESRNSRKDPRYQR